METLLDFDEPDVQLDNIVIITEVPGVGKKDHETPQAMKILTQEMIADQYNPQEWTHVFTDGSSEEATKNGGAGIFISNTNYRVQKSFPTGKISSNYRAETVALLHAVKIITELAIPPQKVVFFTDCRSLLQGLQNNRSDKPMKDIRAALYELSRQSTITLQWVPSHCGITGNEKADDALSKAGSKMEQFNHPVTYREAKTIIHNYFRSRWKRRQGAENGADAIHQLQRHQQTTLFRLRTGHCRLFSHLNRLKISHTDQCPCNTGPQTPEHVLLHCPTHETLRQQTWPEGTELQRQLWGARPDLEKTVGFIMKTGLLVWCISKTPNAEEEEEDKFLLQIILYLKMSYYQMN